MLTANPNSTSHLLSGRLLARNTVWNLAGLLLPMAVAVVAMPLLVKGLGVARFGILSLAWVVIGYFNFFDLGLGRAVTKLVADKASAGEEHNIPPLAWTSLALLLFMGIFGGVVTSLISPLLVHRLLKIPEALQPEALESFWVLAASIPLVTSTSGLRGILEAQQRFRLLNLIRIPSSTFSFAGPLLVLPFSHSVVPVIAVLLAGRFITALAHLLACFHTMPGLRTSLSFDRSVVMPLVRFGGWITVSNFVAPVLTNMDRLLIGAVVSVSAVAYYSAPYDLVTRVSLIPGSVVGVLFPAFALSYAQDRDRAAMLLSRGTKYILLAMFPIALLMIALAPEGLRLWLGPIFAENSAAPLRWLAAGVLVNALAYSPYALIQAAGKPDFTAKLHLAELLPYVAALWFLTKTLGIEGTAMAWFGRVTVDAAVLFFYACRLLPQKARFVSTLGVVAAVALALFVVVSLPQSLAVRAVILGVGLVAFAIAGWFRGLVPAERAFLLGRRKAPVNMKATPAAD